MINFIVIGGGWRAEFYLRIAKALPEIFSISAICIRNSERANYIRKHFNVKVVSTVDNALKTPFDFVVNCINKDDISDLSVELADRGYYVLAETPVTKPQSEMHNYDNIQIAEQFHLKGTYQAVKCIIDSGLIGKVGHINMSMAHDYHAMSLIRFLLNDYDEPEILGEFSFKDTMLETNGRIGEFSNKKIMDKVQKVRLYQFNDATAVYDYNIEQYFSPIRKDRLLIRGTRGEIENNQVRYFNKNDEFVCSEIKHLSSGLLDGFFNDKIVFENKVLYDFPYKHARLSEEESAIAECLANMSEYIKNGKLLYSYKRGYEDFSYFSSNK